MLMMETMKTMMMMVMMKIMMIWSSAERPVSVFCGA